MLRSMALYDHPVWQLSNTIITGIDLAVVRVMFTASELNNKLLTIATESVLCGKNPHRRRD